MEYDTFKQTAARETIEALLARKTRVAAAEIGTGGLFARALSSVPGAQGAFCKGLSFPDGNAVKGLSGVGKKVFKKGSPSQNAAAALAFGIRKRTGAGIGVGISAAGPKSHEAHIALCVKGKASCQFVCRRVDLSGTEEDGRGDFLALQALSLLLAYLRGDKEALGPLLPFKTFKKALRPPLIARFFQFFLPWPGDRAGDVLIKLILIAAVITGGWAASMLGQELYADYQSLQVIARAVKALEQRPTPEQIENLPQDSLDKFAAAYAINSDLVGWLTIPGTGINLPVVQTTDNDYYLSHSFEKAYDINGVPFLDFRNVLTPELYDNTLIYGHNMEPSFMFHNLLLYRDLDFYKENPVLTFDTIYEESQWKIIACFEATTDPEIGEVFAYYNFLLANSEEEKQWYIDEVIARSYFITDVDVNTGDKLLTIQTCANDRYNTKVCLVARKVRDGEDSSVNTENAAVNPNRVLPSRYE